MSCHWPPASRHTASRHLADCWSLLPSRSSDLPDAESFEKEKEGNIEYLLHRMNIIKLPCLLVLLMSFHSEVPYESYSSGALG